MHRARLTLSVTAAAIVATAAGFLDEVADWPSYHGPHGDRRSPETITRTDWGDRGPKVVWEAGTQRGFSSFAVADGRAFTIELRDRAETLVARKAADGKEVWSAKLGDASYDGGGDAGADGNKGGDGPRSTPTVSDGRVYCYDAAMTLHCVDAASGKPVWSHAIAAEFEGRTVQWQNAMSPLLHGGRVFVVGGGAGKSFLAFDAKSGELAWSTGDETMTHAMPVVARLGGVEQIVCYVRSGLVALAPADGAELWRIEYPFRTSSAASPVVHGDIVYVSAGYGVGAGAWRVTRGDDGAFTSELLWRKRNDLMNHWSTPVAHDGHLYGMFSFKKYGEGPLCCVELATGEVKWEQPGYGPGNAILVGDTLVALSDSGEVALVAADPAGYRELARHDVLDGKCWSSPAFSRGKLYVRSTEQGACLDLR